MERPKVSDPLTKERIGKAHPIVLEELKCIYEEICLNVNTQYTQIRFTDVFRTPEKQDQLYAQGRTKPGNKVTWAKGGYSYHNYGLAVDIALILDLDRNGSFETASWDVAFDGDKDKIADWLEVAKIFNFYGWEWGLINSKGKRYDLPHFQKTFGYKASEFRAMEKDKNGYPIIRMDNC